MGRAVVGREGIGQPRLPPRAGHWPGVANGPGKIRGKIIGARYAYRAPTCLRCVIPPFRQSLPDEPFLKLICQGFGLAWRNCGTRASYLALPAELRHPLGVRRFPVRAGRDGTRKNPFVVEFKNLNHFALLAGFRSIVGNK